MISTFSTKSEAHLLVYQLMISDYHEYVASLNKTLKKFTAKPITQVGITKSGICGWDNGRDVVEMIYC